MRDPDNAYLLGDVGCDPTKSTWIRAREEERSTQSASRREEEGEIMRRAKWNGERGIRERANRSDRCPVPHSGSTHVRRGLFIVLCSATSPLVHVPTVSASLAR
ncbi:hypothetical protein BHE74_00055073 [Ensete ventricosum]|uniref:Uncharacterized protein n=1 Tax=Ensete ventricosum TaxID=4639 RepID=A0A427A0A1_ENSVE|nr:hypothetical protein B296_00013762 [Ensete ventricosum]RWW39587.1 hypothetical protein BHE74_00055073 [Ensete ventricosum]RZS26408.1 hypothetical protein BHM03_00059744 [Ensete ventricosum]